MQTLDPVRSSATLTNSQRMALISLLVDDDPAIYQMVRGQLLSYGGVAVEWLRPHSLSSDPKMRRRALEIIHHHARLVAHERFLDFCLRNGEELDLEQATGLLARTRFPEINPDAYSALYDAWAGELRERLNRTAAPEHALGTVTRFLFEELGFSGNDQHGYDPDCCYLNRIVDKRAGNPIGLCVVLLFVARRLRLPVTGIGLPGHFICRYQSSTKEIFIDCFRKGIFLSKADCVKYLLQTNFGATDGHLGPVSPRRTLLRMCNNLVNTYGHLEMTEEAARVQRYIAALTR
jgi:regulator of sirC expression with transglutaminase-like and TPR domain